MYIDAPNRWLVVWIRRVPSSLGVTLIEERSDVTSLSGKHAPLTPEVPLLTVLALMTPEVHHAVASRETSRTIPVN